MATWFSRPIMSVHSRLVLNWVNICREFKKGTFMDKTPLPFAKLMGLTITEITPERVTAELKVRDDLCTRPAVLHGGAIMAFADTIGAYATVANLPEGVGTTTLESKTNFFAAIPAGDTAKAECT